MAHQNEQTCVLKSKMDREKLTSQNNLSKDKKHIKLIFKKDKNIKKAQWKFCLLYKT